MATKTSKPIAKSGSPVKQGTSALKKPAPTPSSKKSITATVGPGGTLVKGGSAPIKTGVPVTQKTKPISKAQAAKNAAATKAKLDAAAAAKAKAIATANATVTDQTVNGVGGLTKDQATWLAGDASFGATNASLAQQLASYQADRLNQRNNYAADEVNALDKLGFKHAVYTPGVATSTNAAPTPTVNTSGAGWDQHDESGAFGRDMVANADQAAARGAAGSGAYFKAAGNIGQQYADQGSAILQAANRQQSDYTSDLSNYQSSNRQAQTQALYDALQRRSASMATLT